jgi:hypothetical protein
MVPLVLQTASGHWLTAVILVNDCILPFGLKARRVPSKQGKFQAAPGLVPNAEHLPSKKFMGWDCTGISGTVRQLPTPGKR